MFKSRAAGDQHLQHRQQAGLPGHEPLARVLLEDAAEQLPSPPPPARLHTQALLTGQAMLGFGFWVLDLGLSWGDPCSASPQSCKQGCSCDTDQHTLTHQLCHWG